MRPNYLKRWINLKKVIPIEKVQKAIKNNDKSLDVQGEWSDNQRIEKSKPCKFGMTDMLDWCGLKMVGRHHSGIDDSRNIANVALKLLEHGFVFNQAMVLSKK